MRLKNILFLLLQLLYLNLFSNSADTLSSDETKTSDLIIYETPNSDSISTPLDSTLLNTEKILHSKLRMSLSPQNKLIYDRLRKLDDSSPMDFTYNKYTQFYIDRYLGRDVKLISRMLKISEYYFPMMEQQLDKFQIPLELKYLSIVESALNPKARSGSGATGLWQFMYPTGKEYGLEVTSYIDERQDPLKSTIAACEYFTKLYEMFGDWNLVLAAYNGGPGYLSRLIAKKELNDFWELRQYLRKETQGYVPKFIAVAYVMTYYKEHNIEVHDLSLGIVERDTISFKEHAPYNLISEMFCVSNETINYLNPSFKKEILPKGETICLPSEVIMDMVLNEDYFYEYIHKVEKKEILVDEIRIVYEVQKGDYLGKIAKLYGLSVSNIKEWNKMHSDNLSIGDKLILYLPDES